MISSRFFSEERLSINGWQSNGNIVTVSCGACDPQFARQPDGRWLFVGIGDGNWTLYRVYDDFVTDAFALTLHDSNDVIHYGEFALERELTNADFTAYPDYIRDVIPLLDSSEFACVRSDGTPMWESPNGKLLATCYARLTGRIIQHENGYVQLQIGSEEYGMVGWFEEDDLAFGMDIEAVRCGFPSHSEEDCNRDYLVHVLNDVDLAEFTNTTCLVWLIGEKPEGNWLVQLNVETVCTASADSFRNIGPASELWAQFEAEYDHFEQEMQKGVGEAYDRPGK